MKNYLFLLNILYSTLLFAQSTFSGIILDKKTKEHLEGVILFNKEFNLKTSTNKQGYFKTFIQGKKKPTFKIKKSNYKTIFIEFHKKNIVILLQKEPHEQLDEVIVSSFSNSSKKKKLVGSSTLSKKKDLEKISSNNLIDALFWIHPSISQISTGSSISKPVIRGLGHNRVVVAQNGIRQEQQQWGDEHGMLINGNEVEKVEILNSSSNLLFGADAMAGVINIITTKRLPKNTFKGFLSSEYQINNGLYEIAFNQEGRLENIFWKTTFSGLQAGNYQNQKDEKVFNSAFKNLNFSGSLGYNYKWGSTEFFTNLFSQKLGINEGNRNSKNQFIDNDGRSLSWEELHSYQIFYPFQKLSHYITHLKQKFILNKHEILLDLAYQRNQREELESKDNDDFHTDKKDNDNHPYNHDHRDHHNNKWLLQTFNYILHYKLPSFDKWQPTIGISGMFQKNKNLAATISLPNYSLFDLGGVAHIAKKINKFYLEGGLRYDIRILKTEKFTNETNEFIDAIHRKFKALSSSIGFSYLPNSKLNLKLNYSKGFRAPNLNELSANGSHTAANRYEKGNSNLKPEINHQIESTLIYEQKNGFVEFSGFYNYISNFIFIYNTSKKHIDKNVFEYGQKNASYLYGGEIITNLNPSNLKILNFRNSLGFVKARFANEKKPDHKYVPFIPATKFQSQLELKFNPAQKHIKEWFINLGYTHFFDKTAIFSAYQTESLTPGYGILSAGLGFNIQNKKQKEIFRLLILGTNLLNKTYVNHLSRFKFKGKEGKPTTIYNMGRNITFKVIIPFGF